MSDSDWVDVQDDWVDVEAPTPKQSAQPKAKQPRQRGLFEKIYDASGSILQGATFGFGDELTAGVGGALGGNYDEILAKDRSAQKRYEAENPYESMMFEIGGGLPLAFATPGAGAGALTKLATMGSQARSAKGLMGAGAAYGALTGFGKGEGDGGNRLASALVGGTVGGAMPLAIKGATGAIKPIAQRLDGYPGVLGEVGALFPGGRDAVARKTYLTGQEVKQALEKSGLNLDDLDGHYGIRFDPKPYEVGESLPPSRVWSDGDPVRDTSGAYEYLSGTSTVLPDRLDNARYEGPYAYLVRGADSYEGNDFGERVIDDAVVERVLLGPEASLIKKILGGNEKGALFPKQSGAAPLTKAEATIFQRLRNVPTEQLTSMQDEMARALTEGTPLYLPEAGGKYGKKKLFDFASYIANREGGASFAERAIGERAEGAGARIGGILDELSPQSDPRMGGFSLMDAVKGKVDELKEIRTKAAEPFYQRAMQDSPSIDPQDLSQFMRGNGTIKGIISDLRTRPQWANVADNSRELMHRAKVRLDEMLSAEDLLPTDKAELMQIKDNLVNLLEQVDLPQGANLPLEIARTVENATKPAAGPSAYGAGRAIFADKSAPIDEIMNGPLGGFLQHNYNPENVGTSVLGMSAPAVEIGIGQLGSADAIRAAARSGISKRIGNKGDTRNLAEALIGAENPRKMLSTLMGPDGADNILRRLELEDRMAKGKNLYQRGSTTARNLLEEETFNKSGAVVDRLLKALASPKGALFQTVGDLKNLGLASGKEDLARALAGILFDTQQGADTLQKVIPYAMRRNEIAGQYDNLAAALARGSRPLLNRAIPNPQGE